ncbi:MAG: hypothetical protein KUG81_09240 [Gammaproteobacteria bacterium]|nr:hypothetical protein [Gammaproteobacteria bacterium]
MSRSKKVFGDKNGSVVIVEKSLQPKNKDREKWSAAVKDQINLATQLQHINARFVELDAIDLDPKNGRSFSCSIEEMKSGPKLNCSLEDATNKEGEWREFESSVNTYFNGNKKKIDEYLELGRLALNIKEPIGLINPVTIVMNNTRFDLLAGHRRTLAHYILNSKVIAAQIREKESPLSQHIIRWSENEGREDLSLKDKLNDLKSVIDQWQDTNGIKISTRKLENLLGIKKSYAGYYLKILREDDALFWKVMNLGFLKSLEATYNIARIESLEEKHRLLNEIILNKGIKLADTRAASSIGKKGVQSLDTLRRKSKYGLSIKKNTNTDVFKKMLGAIVTIPELESVNQRLDEFDTTSNEGILNLFDTVYLELEKNIKVK